jgi:DNA-binding transcriptional regulator YdaS (Cro superfamily)
MSTVSELIDAAGGVTKVAEAMQLPVGTVSAWSTRNRVPAERVLEFERATGHARHLVRPDLYPPLPAPSPVPA